jgi:hypothetical protein
MSARENNPLEETSSGDLKSIQEIPAELDDAIPPWKKSTHSDRLRLIWYYTVVYIPVAFVVIVELIVVALFILFYVLPLVGSHESSASLWYWHSSAEHSEAKVRGWVLLGVMLWILFWLNLSFIRAVVTNPGEIPRTQEWILSADSDSSSSPLYSVERRMDGNPRHCTRCMRRKPDRCHHCRLCDNCVLKMDHHCPWIANCVGYENYKYFFLLITYSVLGLLLFVGSFWEAVAISLNDETFPIGLCLILVSSYALASLLLFAIIGFWSYHVYLIYNDMTTIEFCEKRRHDLQYKSRYQTGLCLTLRSIFGDTVWIWPFPFRKS